jgi:two-component system response regulator PilR (NtrC family)
VVRPVGATQEVSIDVRVVAATNRDLGEMVATGGFREDLYYRISVIPIHVPALRERRDDIALLAAHFLKKYAPAAGKSIARVSPQAVDALCAYDWPGNVRQLENTIERAVAMEAGSELRVEIPMERPRARAAAAGVGGESFPSTVAVPDEGLDMERYVAQLERSLIESALRQSNGVQTRAAELLKLSYRSFRHLVKKYDV